jgi:pyridinium-3,5-bisthiocarboxylic acid mononucleotide nickel chelatase
VKIAYFDTISGIAGDMAMAAFVSAGVPVDFLAGQLQALPIEGFEIVARHVQRSSISTVHIDVVIQQPETQHRHVKHIESLIQSSTLSDSVKQRAIAIYRVIAEAEARVHNTTIEKVHLHEVGALDSIVDVVGVSICLEHFGIERVYSSPVRLGSGGTVMTEHGIIPTPAPATLEILKGYPVVFTKHPYELTTPTGAAIIKALSSGVLDDERLRPSAIGYGAGTKEFSDLPNFLRVVIGDLDPEVEAEDILVVETNIDDMNPQVYPFLIEQLLASGAHDAYLVPIIMKKGRPGMLLSAMVASPRLDDVVSTMYRQTTTIGLRIQRIGRRKLPRRELQVQSSFGAIRAKVVIRDGREVVAPEYEECRRIAVERNLPLLDVMKTLERELSGTTPSA